MPDIFERINELTEKFSNLFEVDDLGQPAMDVPPSQNKIKKDRKTKDGKVELVSVEDELFPYDGNKREQYRQKILDTINNMIQGTATLEDLLQITRQKKAPLKEAMEVLESLINETSDKKAQAALDAAKQRYYQKSTLAGDRLVSNIGNKEETKKAADDLENARNEYSKHIQLQVKRARRLGKKLVQDPNDHDSFKIAEAMELMEAIINEVSNKTVENALDQSDHNAVMSLFKLPQTTFHKYKKLKDMADKRAARHGEKIEVNDDGETRKHTHVKADEALEEALNVLLEGRKEGESQKDFKHRLHGELVRAIDKKAAEARDKAIEASKNYYETGKGRAEAIKASEKAKKEHDKLGKLDDIEPVANAYMTVESLKEAIELMEALLSEEDFHARKGNPVVKITDKNYRAASGKSLSGPFNKNHIGKYIVYNKDTDASYLVSPENWQKSKIKRDLEKQGKVYEAIRLMEELLNEKVTVAKWVEAAKKVKDARADKASKELMKNIFGKEDNGDEAHNAVHRQAHAEAVSKLAPSDDNAQDVREIHRAAIEPLRKKVDRAVKAGKSTTEAVERLEKAQEIAGVRPDSSKYVN